MITQAVQHYVMGDRGRKLRQWMVQFIHWLWIGGGRISSPLEKVS